MSKRCCCDAAGLLLLLVGVVVWRVRKASARRKRGTASLNTHCAVTSHARKASGGCGGVDGGCLCRRLSADAEMAGCAEASNSVRADPLRDLRTRKRQRRSFPKKIRANPQDSEQWARLGEAISIAMRMTMRCWHIVRRCVCEITRAALFAALATVLYYQSGQHMTPATREMINKALALDATEVTAQMLLAAGCVYAGGLCASRVALWQTLLDANCREPRAAGRGH